MLINPHLQGSRRKAAEQPREPGEAGVQRRVPGPRLQHPRPRQPLGPGPQHPRQQLRLQGVHVRGHAERGQHRHHRQGQFDNNIYIEKYLIGELKLLKLFQLKNIRTLPRKYFQSSKFVYFS